VMCVLTRQDAVHEHQRQMSRMLRDMPSAAPAPAPSGTSPPAARSAPSEGVATRMLERLSSSHDAAVNLRDAGGHVSSTAGGALSEILPLIPR
jgi:hypothetical protein